MSEEATAEAPEEFTEEEKGLLRGLIDVYKEATKRQREFNQKIDMPRVHRILAAKKAPLVLTLLFGAEKAWADAIGYEIPENADGVYASSIVLLGVTKPEDTPQILLDTHATPVLVELVESAFHSLVRMNGLSALNPLLDIMQHLMGVVADTRRALEATGCQIQAAMVQARNDAMLDSMSRMPPQGEA